MSKNNNVRVIAIDKQLESMSKSLKQLSSNVYAGNYELSCSLFALSSFVHKMLVAYNQGADADQTVILTELGIAYAKVKELTGAPTN